MKEHTGKIDEYPHEHRFLEWAKGIRDNRLLSKEKLSQEYRKLVDEYEAVLTKLHLKNYLSGALSPEEILETESRLFSGISHEFRTPLTLLITALEEMHDACNCAEQKKKLSLMLLNAQRLLFIIKQALALSEIGRKDLILKADPHDLISFLKGIIASFDFIADRNDVELIFDAKEQNIILYIDPGKMAEVMCNLLMNALKYTPAGGQVKVSVYQSTPDAATISVRDTGPGIPADLLKSIFDRYYHLHKPYESHKKGFGVGLYLVKEYITLHGGAIQVKSAAAEGTEFIIQLPIEKGYLIPGEVAGAPVPDVKETVGSGIAAHHVFMLQLEREGASQPNDNINAIEINPEGRYIVLVVEDSIEMRRFIRNLLMKYYIIVEAENGRDGISIAKKIIPDIIVSDIVMPEVDGVQMCRDLKNDLETSHIPIILLTARAEEQEVIRGLEAGADDYITKPFNVEMLITRIKNLIQLRRRLQEKIAQRMRFEPREIPVSSLDNEFIKKLQAVIEKYLSDPEFNVEQLAHKLYMSPSTLRRKIEALTGETTSALIRSYRLARAAQLLKARFGNVTEVAFAVGFSDSSYFARCFKEKFNRSPHDYTGD